MSATVIPFPRAASAPAAPKPVMTPHARLPYGVLPAPTYTPRFRAGDAVYSRRHGPVLVEAVRRTRPGAYEYIVIFGYLRARVTEAALTPIIADQPRGCA